MVIYERGRCSVFLNALDFISRLQLVKSPQKLRRLLDAASV